MARKYLPWKTVLNIVRQYQLGENVFSDSYAEIQNGGYLNSDGGTVAVSVNLHPDEYCNFEGCGVEVFTDDDGRLYLESAPDYGHVLIREGRLARYNMLNDCWEAVRGY